MSWILNSAAIASLFMIQAGDIYIKIVFNRKMDKQVKGLNIVKMADGTVHKLIVE